MKFITDASDLRYTYEGQSNVLLEKFSRWSEELIDLFYSRVFGDSFKKVLDFVLSIDFENKPISRLTEEEISEQLIICSQYKFTFSQMRDDIDLYIAKIQRRYTSWSAPLYIKSRKSVIDGKYILYKEGKLTKANISVTTDEVKNQFLVDNAEENAIWNDFLDYVRRARSFVSNVVDDFESRSMILMSLRKRYI